MNIITYSWLQLEMKTGRVEVVTLEGHEDEENSSVLGRELRDG